ncbi:sensor histidine kinase [Dictyobacter kobayashii]|uniref:histidine kinase n=1 Tax=Dictyobacter kobayashii TaxID=2014872 RepID=A0A402APY2_9CHLR|nr:sensor histidine kinase [Dictyobacter kobayashii]GCE21089.1 histidine kinase [Dictyobacter kobayashii]
MNKVVRVLTAWLKSWHLSLFEKVILVNSIMLIGEALAALWVTSHQLEVHHYLIDTIFIVMAALFTLFANIILLRASFRPLFELLKTIRAVGSGQMQERARVSAASWEIGELAQAFNSMLDRLELARRERTRVILQAQENERRRIGMELHDETGQNLTALLIHTEVLHQHFQVLAAAGLTEQAKKQLDSELLQLTHLTQLSLENVRVLAQQLRPSVLDDLGLLAAFRWLGEDSSQRLRLQVELDLQQIEPMVKELPASYETALFRIAQESLTNVARHAHAQNVLISLFPKHTAIYLTIQDDGNGYRPEDRKAGTGILGMRERATSLGGTLTIISNGQQGTTVQAVLPAPTARNQLAIIEQNKG